MRSLLPATFDIMREFALAESVAAVHQVLLKHAAPMGAVNVLAAIIPDRIVKPSEQSRYLVLGAWPEAWIERYFEKQYVRRDPTILHSMTKTDPVRWSELTLSPSDPGRRMMDEAREFLLSEGLTIPQLTIDGHRIALSFSGERIDRSPEAVTTLTILASYAVARALQIRAMADFGTVNLTQRERECLVWISDGKTFSDVADILGVTEAMINKHMSAVRAKLGALNVTQAVAQAIRLGLI